MDDEQLALAETTASSSIAFNISAIEQEDANGYGPAYLVNGLTNEGDWFQAGIAYDWSCGDGYAAGFSFVYEVWASGGIELDQGLENTTVNDGDLVAVQLQISDGNVAMTATDPTTDIVRSFDYSAFNATTFVGVSTLSGQSGFFTGPMTEWYHARVSNGSESEVTYSAITPLSKTVQVGIDEWVPSTGSLVFIDEETMVLSCACLQSFSYEGTTLEASNSEFISG
jgi:hypothetical protein